ncbi:hypothetical protein CP982_35180 [Streptomyces spectabilis]|uniref:XRE family transcriptional regulator n=1 Tax=Streptomyces spectabilis TaxID=68270 RepID=A0A5P2XKL2_STRST|nr:hypothetical protein CP982_35180 [Streptomyces spectabilis]
MGFPEEIIPARVAEHLIAKCQIRPRTAWRLAADLSLDQAARHYNVIRGDAGAGMRGSRIWEYEQWPDRGVRPTLPALRTLAQVYGAGFRDLLDLCDLEQLPPGYLAEYHAAAAGAPGTPSVAVTGQQPQGAAVPTPSRATAVVGENVLAEAMILTKTNVDDVQLDDLWSDMTYLGNAYAHAPPASVLRQLSLVRERAAALLKNRQRPKQTRDLYVMSAKCCAMMAWTSADLGRYDTAQELNSAAWLYYQYADDPLARRWVRTAQARVEYWAGNGAESARLAADGLAARVGKGMADGPLILAEARGWATVQAEQRVLDAVGRWARIEDVDPAIAEEDRFFNISKDRRHYMAGTSLLSVGRTDLALKELRTARQAYGALAPELRWEVMELMIRIEKARAYLRLGELDGAAAELEPFLSTDVGEQPDMVRAVLKAVATELAAPRWQHTKAARDLMDSLSSAQMSV